MGLEHDAQVMVVPTRAGLEPLTPFIIASDAQKVSEMDKFDEATRVCSIQVGTRSANADEFDISFRKNW
jgi:hypothetical protein